MKKHFFASMMMLLAVATAFVSCSDDDDSVAIAAGELTVEMPINFENVEATVQAVLTNVQTQEETRIEASKFVESDGNYKAAIPEIPVGNYNVSVTGHMTFTLNGVAGEKDFEYTAENESYSVSSPSIKAVINSFTAQGGFVISEIFFTGTTTADGGSYSGDQYIKITNNSDVTLYADSIAVVESEFLTTKKQDYTPNILDTDFTVDGIYMIPGTGKSVPVEPGESLTLAVNALNHTLEQPQSIDLSGADFEFYDESSNPNITDPDGPAPNLDKWYCYTATIYQFHNRGFHTMAIAKMQGSKEQFLTDNLYEYNYTFVFGEYSFPMSNDAYRVPNSWILDAVNLSVESEWQWNPISAALDAGWTHCGEVNSDKNRFNKSVIRKQDENGKYIDTNNSTNDFIADAPASLLQK